ncbi:Hsp70 family protein [Singulisphaera acidiphila]|uniref:Molecular chaperone n=1 Tax=Singulisphaera acidiphila (strain ATCC BAA-1392 / DSM 18658 / VKM B-2454 / MOB10) TaxID=886293 RepID=L0DDJ9_SINAD|nr:Hsp70 family protein [Singulisphaera acidiphila]AGA27332.1 molecular chaperone [Singulisphaera acidiphila DSM 18658]
MARSRYIVGIDLGTTNCAVAYVDTKGRERPTADIRLFSVPQLVAPGETAPRPMLPSFLYLPGTHDLPAGAARLPWKDDADRIVGEFARIQGAKVPAHLVASAKSWLCHSGVDREAEILPWASPPGARKVSPVEASADFLRHIRDAWNDQFARDDQTLRLEQQEVVLTVPASFDEAARELTVDAAKKAGLTTIILLEEPQAAFYCWIVSHQEGWQREVRGGELILVCDIGGGTTDFSLITVVETPTGPGFRRVAVGDHLMLGGDNIDLALAHRVEKKLGGVKLDAEQWSALRHACRTAKEKLLGDLPAERWPVTIAGRGSKIIGGSIQSELTRDETLEIVRDGFFPRITRSEEPDRTTKLGLQEFGLPFVSDPAIPKHLNAFLRRHRAEAVGQGGHAPDDRPARPDAILFNGGALTPTVVRDRLVEVVSSWFPDDPGAPYAPRVLSNASLDLAVAYGAAYYGVVRRGGGIRIGGGTARSFYVGFQSETVDRPWLCVVPRDAQEGDEIAIDNRDFDLLMGQPVAFPLASSSVRPDDKPGDLVPSDPDSIRELPPLQSLMRVGRKAKAERAPVRLAARVTEVGTIELWCQSRTDDRRWRLQIQLRGPAGTPAPSGSVTGRENDRVVIEQSILDTAIEAIQVAFGPVTPSEELGPSRLIKRLEEILDSPRDQWPPSALRAMWEPLRDLAEARLKGPRHESRWYNLAGFCLRPGTGFPLDETRIKAVWPVFHQGVRHTKDLQCWAEWWILWRRVSAGLSRAHHDEISRRLIPFLVPSKAAATKKGGRPRPEAHELAEMWRCAASLERLAPDLKVSYGNALVKELSLRESLAHHLLWCLGRLGARVLLYGPANTVVPRETAERWTRSLLERPFAPGRETTDAIFALAQLARVSGDRARDLDDALRTEVLQRLEALGADEVIRRPVREYHELEAEQQGQALGDALPVGLRLLAGAETAGS